MAELYTFAPGIQEKTISKVWVLSMEQKWQNSLSVENII